MGLIEEAERLGAQAASAVVPGVVIEPIAKQSFAGMMETIVCVFVSSSWTTSPLRRAE